MKKSILAVAAAVLFATPVLADKPATLSCYFQSGEGGTTMISWDNKGFRSAASNFEAPWLTVVEVSDTGNMFKMAMNVKTKDAYAETKFTDGHKSGGPLWCAFQ